MLKEGVKGVKTMVVTEEFTASHMLSGLLPVYATPAMVSFMEYTCSDSVQALLDDGMGTVGTCINIKHLSASPIGATIRCESELTCVDGRRLVFEVKAYDNFDLIGLGTHERFIINEAKFMAKVDAKLNLFKEKDAK